jgi:hypothetical protein
VCGICLPCHSEAGLARWASGQHGEYAQLGEARLSAGPHQLLLRYDSKPLSPGTSTPKELSYPTGPLAVSSAPDDPGVRFVKPDQAGELCGRDWDWVEAVAQ